MTHRLFDARSPEIGGLFASTGMADAGWPLLAGEYARTNRSEFFAESFVLHSRGGEAAEFRIHPVLVEFFRRDDRLSQ
jgi:hypothetical protein